jgi:hypothetical protein
MTRDEMNASDIRQLVDACEAAGLADAVAPVAAMLDRRDEIEREFTVLLATGTDVRPTAERIAAGEIDLAGGVAELGGVVAMFDAGPTPMIRHLRDVARRFCLDAARRYLTDNAAALSDTAEDVSAEVDAAIDKLRPKLDGIGSDADAARVGGPAAKAWLKRKDLDERRSRLGEIPPIMLRLGLLESVVA